jgi:4-amino-4-deoxy-L-arabinose transferase-like glycosyltransferase
MTETRNARLAAWSIFVLVLLIRAPLVDVPFERDEGEYAYIAWRLSFGELPYVDWFDQKPPAVFWTYRLALSLPVQGTVSVHLLAALFSAASAAVLFFLTRMLVGVGGAVAAALALAFLSADPTVQGTAANTEVFMLLPLIGSCWLFAHVVRNRKTVALAVLLVGLLTGLASAFKQVAAINWLFFALTAPFLFSGERRVARSISLALWSTVGLLMVWVALGGYFLAKGGVEQFVDAVFTHNLEYAQALSLETRLHRLVATSGHLLRSQLCVWILAAVGIIFCIVWHRRLAVFLSGWLVASAIGVSAGGHYFPHYFQQLLPPLAVGAGIAVAELSRICSRWFPSVLTVGVLSASIVAPPALVLASFWSESTPEDVVRRIYPGNPFDVMPGVAAVIEAITAPDDEVFIFGAEPEVLFYSKRRSASRYIYLFPVYGPFAEAGRRQREVVREIRDSEPRVIFMMPNAMFFAANTDQSLTRWLMAYAASGYERHVSVWLDESGRRRIVATGTRPPDTRLTKELGAVFVRRRGF